MSDLAEPGRPESTPLQEVRRWVERVVVGLNLCPFAAAPLAAGRVGFVLSEGPPSQLIDELLAGVDSIDAGRWDTLLIVAPGLGDWELFLDLVQASELLLEKTGLEQRFQLAHFHPEYCFEGVEPDDPSNHTNRAPYPTVHLIRTQDVARAVASHPDIESIPKRNVALMRELAERGELP